MKNTNQAANRDDDNTNDDRNATIGHSRQRQSTRDTPNSTPANLLNGIESCDDLVGIPAHRESTDGDLSQSSGRSHSCAESRERSPQQGPKDDDKNALSQRQTKFPSEETYQPFSSDVRGVWQGRAPYQSQNS